MSDERRCRVCREWTPFALLKRNAKHREGVESLCRTCDAARFRRYRLANLEVTRERERRSAQKRRDRVRAIRTFLAAVGGTAHPHPIPEETS